MFLEEGGGGEERGEEGEEEEIFIFFFSSIMSEAQGSLCSFSRNLLPQGLPEDRHQLARILLILRWTRRMVLPNSLLTLLFTAAAAAAAATTTAVFIV